MCCVEGSPKFTPGDTWPGKGGDQDLLCIVARCVGCPDDMAIRVSEPSTFGKRDVADAVRLSMPGGWMGENPYHLATVADYGQISLSHRKGFETR
jgi:hypothetical protein